MMVVMVEEVAEHLYAIDRLFFHLGTRPRSDIAQRLACALDDDGYVDVDRGQETSVTGVHAAGTFDERLLEDLRDVGAPPPVFGFGISQPEHVEAARITGIGVENRSIGVLGEYAKARSLGAEIIPLGIIIVDLALEAIGFGEGYAEVGIEIASERGNPSERPAHSLLEGRSQPPDVLQPAR